MTRFCANCGTEVDDNAAFCPTCGQPIDQADEVGIPPAPAWPEPSPPTDAAPPPERSTAPPAEEPSWADLRYERARGGTLRAEDPTQVEAQPPPGPQPTAAAPPPRAPAEPVRPASPAMNLPITWPVTLSAWLIGIGALAGAVGALIGVFGGVNVLDLLLLILLIGIAVTVFFASNVPTIPYLRLATLAIVLIGFGMALDRISIGVAGAGELLLFLGTAAAGMGCVLLELGRDQPLGGPQH